MRFAGTALAALGLGLCLAAASPPAAACDFDDLAGRLSDVDTVQVVMPRAATNFHWRKRRARPHSEAFPPLEGEVARHTGLMYLFAEDVVPVRFIAQAIKRGDAAIVDGKGAVARIYAYKPDQTPLYEQRLAPVETVDGCALLILPPGEFAQNGAIERQTLRFIPAPEPTP